MTGKFIGGWKTLNDGSRVPGTETEASDLWAYIECEDARRAAAYPQTGDALRAFCDAGQRLKSLGWRGYTFGIEDGAEVAVVERGSTGIFHGFWQKPYFHYADCVGAVGKVLWKPVSELTADEAATMDECSKSHVEFMNGQFAMMARLDGLSDGGEE